MLDHELSAPTLLLSYRRESGFYSPSPQECSSLKLFLVAFMLLSPLFLLTRLSPPTLTGRFPGVAPFCGKLLQRQHSPRLSRMAWSEKWSGSSPTLGAPAGSLQKRFPTHSVRPGKIQAPARRCSLSCNTHLDRPHLPRA